MLPAGILFPFSSLVCKWLAASVAFASGGSSHTASPSLREVAFCDKPGSCDVFFFPRGGRSLPAFVHLHPWDAVDVLLGLLCPPIVVFVNLCVTELSFLFFVHVGLLSDAVIFLVWFCLFHPRGSHMFLLADLSYVVFSQLRFTGMSYCLFLVCRLLRAFWHLSSSVRLLTPNLFRAAYFVFVSSLSLSCLKTAFHHLPCIQE